MKQPIVFLSEHLGATGYQDTMSGVVTLEDGSEVPDYPPYSYKSKVQAEQDDAEAARLELQAGIDAQAAAVWAN